MSESSLSERIAELECDNATLRMERADMIQVNIAVMQERDAAEALLAEIAEHPHCIYERGSQYDIGVVDGHRCAAQIAKRVRAAVGKT